MRKISNFRFLGASVLTLAVVACAHQASAIEVKIDYKYDTDQFFAPNSQARAAMNAAAAYFSTILEDTFDEIEVPNKYYSSTRGGEATWFWKRRFTNPQTGFTEAEVNVEVDENAYVVFVGARDLPNSGELAQGGPGGYVSGFVHRQGEFSVDERAEIDAIQATFENAVTARGESSGFGRWGGTITFDSSTAWHFNHNTLPAVDDNPDPDANDVFDFYSVALHELGHALGFGGTDDDEDNVTPWEALISGNNFTGANAVASYVPAGNVPLAGADDKSHWKSDIVASPVYEGTGTQIPVMVPGLDNNLRYLLTDLDAAALADIGWDIDLSANAAATSSIVSFNSASYSSGSGSVAALSVSGVPEPASAGLALLAGTMLLGIRRRK